MRPRVPWFGNINNLLDEDPPIAATHAAFSGNSNHVNSALFDLLGRRYKDAVRFGF